MNNSNLSIFNFESNEVRVLLINGEIWFVAKDICRILGLDQVSRACDRLREKDRGVTLITTPSGDQQMLIISEFGLYELVLSSRKPEAKKFKYWICDEVLPSIRETGFYSIKPMSAAEMFLYSAQKMVELEQKQAQLEAEQTRITQVVTLEAQRTDAIEELVIQHDAELDRIFNSSGHYFTVMGYCSYIGKPIAVAAAGAIGRKATKFCKQNNIDVVPVADPRFGRVNSYPEAVLKQFI